MLSPLALMLTDGTFANWISVDVTYAINGFLPMNIVSLVSVDMVSVVFNDNLKLKWIFYNIYKKFKIIKLKIELKNSLEDILKILESGTEQKKIEILESLNNTNNLKILQQIILRLNDDSIQVRGEAFNALILNQNKISKILIDNLSFPNNNIKGFVSLVLANRNEKNAIPEIIKIVNDEHGMVRSCAMGALGYLKAEKITDIILKALSDPNLEVQKSALQAAIQTNIFVTEEKRKEISKNSDQQMKNLLLKLKK